MRKLIESTFMTIDGVISDPGVWGASFWDEDHAAYARKMLFAADALVLGRKTYEGFASAWPTRSGDDFTDRINAMPKHVASRTLASATWNATVMRGDVGDAIAELKSQPGTGLLKYGTGELDRALVARRLVDEFHLWVFPLVWDRASESSMASTSAN